MNEIMCINYAKIYILMSLSLLYAFVFGILVGLLFNKIKRRKRK